MPTTPGFTKPQTNVIQIMSLHSITSDLVDQPFQNLLRGHAGGVSKPEPEQSVRTLMYEADFNVVGFDGDVA